eukprot:TRINITY_DN4585_c1_g1_i2.p4 TRINITY_DN4585_c1_g1~~TRINITY_DN4585_c1_g1_i2.p4  ORF type:complete len:209 (+),score=-8.66 TRINITY_DN4585_c1_g1_i2:1774-2400(+)
MRKSDTQKSVLFRETTSKQVTIYQISIDSGTFRILDPFPDDVDRFQNVKNCKQAPFFYQIQPCKILTMIPHQLMLIQDPSSAARTKPYLWISRGKKCQDYFEISEVCQVKFLLPRSKNTNLKSCYSHSESFKKLSKQKTRQWHLFHPEHFGTNRSSLLTNNENQVNSKRQSRSLLDNFPYQGLQALKKNHHILKFEMFQIIHFNQKQF